MNAKELTEAAHGRLLQGDPLWEVPRAVADSRQVQPGDLFVAMPGERTDGHHFVAQAIASGARGLLLERAVPLPEGVVAVLVDDARRALLRAARHTMSAYPGLVCAVTGSVGKTTTKEMWAAALSPLGEVFRSPGNYNSDIGMPLGLFRLRQGHRAAVFELGMRGRDEIRRLSRIIRPRIGIVTRIGPSHLGVLGSMDAIVRAKAELLAELPADGVAVLNADDPYTATLRLSAPPRILLAGESMQADIRVVRREQLGTDGTRITLCFSGEQAQGDVRFVGSGAVSDAALAVAGAVAGGVPFGEAVAALCRAVPTQGRLRTFAAGGVTVVDDTYNASPQSAAVALELLSQLPATGRRVAVLGDMRELGPEEIPLHRDLGREAARCADLVLTIGSLADVVAEAARSAGSDAHAFAGLPDLLAALRQQVAPGDAVLFKASRAIGLDALLRDWQEGLS